MISKVGAAAALILTYVYSQEKQECDLMCAAIYSFDLETCQCKAIEWMECHP